MWIDPNTLGTDTGRRSKAIGATTGGGVGSDRQCESPIAISSFLLHALIPPTLKSTCRRIATEIKLHKTINSLTYEFYRSVTPLGPGASDALNDARAWTWKLLFVAEIA
jgi:hypothetical protein